MTDNEILPTQVVTAPVRIAFPALWKPEPTTKGGDKMRYGLTMLMPPDFDRTPLVECLRAAMVAEWGQVIDLEPKDVPIKACESKGEKRPTGYDDGWFFARARTQFRPKVYDRALNLLDPDNAELGAKHPSDIVYAGCWCRVFLSTFPWVNSGRRGVSFSLEQVQFHHDDEHWQTGPSVNPFEPLDALAEPGVKVGQSKPADPFGGLLGTP